MPFDLGLVKITYSVENVNNGMSRQDVFDEYAVLFKGIGLFPGICKLHLKPDAVPVVNPRRRIPEGQEIVKEELFRVEKSGIIQRVTEPSDWVYSMHAVKNWQTKNCP